MLVAGGGIGCSGYSQTSDTRSTATGQLGSLTVTDLRIVAPVGENYPVAGVAKADLNVVNNGTSRDELIGASSPVAGSIQLLHFSDPQPLVPIDGGRKQTQGILLQLRDLRQPLEVRQRVPITLQFRTAGDLTLDVPVQPPAAL